MITAVIARSAFCDEAIQQPCKPETQPPKSNRAIKYAKTNGTLYTGVTSNLIKRVYQHKNFLVPGFTSKHNCKCLVYYELHNDMYHAITREKQIKGGSRKDKLELIEKMNPDWIDLYPGLL